MKRCMGWLAAALMVFGLVGCSGVGIGDGNAKGEVGEVRYEYVAVLANYSRKMTIRPDGHVRVEQQTSKEAKDMIGGEGRLTDAQRADLEKVMRGWKQLKHVYPTDFGTILSISYDGHMVQATPGDKTPPQVLQAKSVLDRIATETLRGAGRLPAATQPVGRD